MAWEIAKGILIAVAILFLGVPIACLILWGIVHSLFVESPRTKPAPEMETVNWKGTCILVEKQEAKRLKHSI
jgi:hypothetical protein